MTRDQSTGGRGAAGSSGAGAVEELDGREIVGSKNR